MFEWLFNARDGKRFSPEPAAARGKASPGQAKGGYDAQREALKPKAGGFDTGAWARRSWATDIMGGIRSKVAEHTGGPKAPENTESTFVAEKGDTNQTSRYHTLAQMAENGETVLPADAENYVYLNVPGLVTEHYVGYMDQNMKQMTDMGLDARMAPIDTDAAVTTNAKTLRDEILAIAKETGKQVVLTGHSKGGVDIGAAMALYPELQAHVRAVVTMQSPYEGTEIADDIVGHKQLAGLTTAVLEKAWKGDRRALSDLQRGTRKDFNAKHPYASQVPTVSMLSSIGDQCSGLAASGTYLARKHGRDSDGMVPTDSAVLPGADYVHLQNMDHSAPANYGATGTSPASMQLALVTLALEKAERQDKKKKEKPK